MNYYNHHLGDYAKDTAHLSMIEHGAYRLLLDRYYATEQPIPEDQVYRVSRARAPDEKKAVDIVLEEFFSLEDGFWRNKRADAEIETMRAHQEKQKANGRKGGRPKKASANPNESQDETQTETQKNPPLISGLSQTEPNTNPNKSPPITNSQYVNPLEANASRVPGDESPGTPTCPHSEIIALYAKHLPMLPQPVAWEGQRQNELRVRWRWVLTAKKPNGQPYATDRESALGFFDRFFAYVAECRFLMGDNDRGWQADLGWLVKSANFEKVLSGRFGDKEAA